MLPSVCPEAKRPDTSTPLSSAASTWTTFIRPGILSFSSRTFMGHSFKSAPGSQSYYEELIVGGCVYLTFPKWNIPKTVNVAMDDRIFVTGVVLIMCCDLLEGILSWHRGYLAASLRDRS